MSEWIPASEQLPNVGTFVLAWKDLVGHRIVQYTENSKMHIKFIRRDGQWWDSGSHITHWMPLPEPPKGVTL